MKKKYLEKYLEFKLMVKIVNKSYPYILNFKYFFDKFFFFKYKTLLN